MKYNIILDWISILLEMIRLFSIAIMPFLMIFLMIATISAIFYSWSEKVSFLTAFSNVAGKMVRFFFEKEDPSFYPDVLLLNRLVEALEPYNELSPEWVNVIYGKYLDTKVSYIRLMLIVDISDVNWAVIMEILQQVFEEEMRKRNMIILRIRIFWQHYEGSKYYIFILYAVTEKEAKAFDEHMERLREYEEKKAIEKTKRTVDEELEQDFEETEKENKNGN